MIASDLLPVKNGLTEHECYHCQGYIYADEDIIFNYDNNFYYHTRCQEEEDECKLEGFIV